MLTASSNGSQAARRKSCLLTESGSVLILGLVNTGFGCYLYFSGIPEISAQTVAVCDYIEPLSAVVLAALVLGEKLTFVQYAGGVLIMAGIVVWNLYPAAHRADMKAGSASA